MLTLTALVLSKRFKTLMLPHTCIHRSSMVWEGVEASKNICLHLSYSSLHSSAGSTEKAEAESTCTGAGVPLRAGQVHKGELAPCDVLGLHVGGLNAHADDQVASAALPVHLRAGHMPAAALLGCSAVTSLRNVHLKATVQNGKEHPLLSESKLRMQAQRCNGFEEGCVISTRILTVTQVQHWACRQQAGRQHRHQLIQ